MIPMTDGMRKEIVERSATLIAKASAPKALRSMRDIEELTGFAYYGKMLQGMIREKSFPRPEEKSSGVSFYLTLAYGSRT